MEKAVEYFEKVIFPLIKKTKNKYRYPKEQMSLVITDSFEGQDNRVLKEFRAKNFVMIRLFRTT